MKTIFVALIFVLCSVAYSEQSPKGAEAPIKKEQVNSAAKDHGNNAIPNPAAEPKPIVGGVISESNRPIDSCYAKCGEYKPDKDWWHEFRTDPVATFTGLLFFATAALWWSTRRLVKGADMTAKKELRAYLGVSGEVSFITPNHIRASVELLNTGKTPAHNVTYFIDGAIRIPTENKIFEEGIQDPRKAPLVPGATRTLGYEFPNVSDVDMESLRKDEKVIFIWGSVKYVDIFGETQLLSFRYRNTAKRLARDPNGNLVISAWILYPEEDGNDTT